MKIRLVKQIVRGVAFVLAVAIRMLDAAVALLGPHVREVAE